MNEKASAAASKLTGSQNHQDFRLHSLDFKMINIQLIYYQFSDNALKSPLIKNIRHLFLSFKASRVLENINNRLIKKILFF